MPTPPHPSKIQSLLAIMTTIGFFGLLIYMACCGAAVSAKDAMNILLGALGAGWMAVISYYFGSSSDAANKPNKDND